MKKAEYVNLLETIDACSGALAWTIRDGGNTPQDCWNNCPRGDWMLWLIHRLLEPPENEQVLRKFTGTKVKCARLVQHLMADGRSLAALDVAERFSEGLATRDELDAAHAYAVAAHAAACAAPAHALAAAAAACAASACALVAACAACAASAPAIAACAASASTEGEKILRKCADIVRADWPDIEEIISEQTRGEK
ncbi:MAG: hypothetical protein PHF37_03115 [Phycisphaerae bacterium]|nr:hypothetical protein [Phycisphaerae bacterium]